MASITLFNSEPGVFTVEDHILPLSAVQSLEVDCLPTDKDQCKNGGWRNYPGFKNQGQCIAFVQRGPKG